MVKMTFSSSRLISSSPYYSLPSVFIFITTIIVLVLNCQLSDGLSPRSLDSEVSFPPRRVGRQLGFGGFGTSFLASLQPSQPSFNRRHQQQQSPEANFFHTIMNLNFDMTEVIAMYRNVTAVAQTPGCLGHCRTPMALWVVQSFYPCYNLQKADCPKGLVCCTQDPSHPVASPNTIHDSRVKLSSPSLASAMAMRDRDRGHAQQVYPFASDEDNSAQPSSASSSKSKPTVRGPTESTTLFDEEYFKNNFIQDEIPE